MCSDLLPPRMKNVVDKNIEAMEAGNCVIAVTGEILSLFVLSNNHGHDFLLKKDNLIRLFDSMKLS